MNERLNVCSAETVGEPRTEKARLGKGGHHDFMSSAFIPPDLDENEDQ